MQRNSITGNRKFVIRSKNDLKTVENKSAEQLCLSCGMCCNGAIFADVALQPDESVQRYQGLGLEFADNLSGGTKSAKAVYGASRDKRTQLNAEHVPTRKSGCGSQHPTDKFLQPCRAFEFPRCAIYSERPEHCRKFECLLLLKMKRGKIKLEQALELAQNARIMHERVLALLRQLRNSDEGTPVGQRYANTAEVLPRAGAVSPKTVELFSELTLAYQDLVLAISQHFWSGD